MKDYLLGNAAIARGILEAGASVVSGYPGTQASEIVETLAPFASKYNIHVEWSVNEKAALEVAIGASWTGVRAVAVMKHVGLNVAADPFMTLAYTGVRGGLVVCVSDDPFCHSSQNEQDSRRYAQFAGIPCLDPADPQEARDMVIYAFELSEALELPVLLRSTTHVSHASADVTVGQIKNSRSNPEFLKNPARWVMLPAHARPRHFVLLDKQAAIEAALETLPWNRLVLRGDIGIITSGISGLYTEEAIKQLEADISILRIGTFPPPVGLCSEFLKHISKVIVIEELEPVLEEHVERLAREHNPNLEILGKRTGHIPREGELDTLLVRNAISDMSTLPLEEVKSLREADEILPPRPPSLCPGCSHRATYYAMKKAFGKDAIFPSDIGCYTLAVRTGTIDTCLCMGASITIASGIRFAGDERDICCSIGDSTFLHTGLPGLLNAAYNKAKITVTILDNSTTAMTGHQPHPGTGFTVCGAKTKAVSVETLAKALGADFVETVDPYNLNATIATFQRAKDYQGLSVVIAKQLCVILARKSGVMRRPFMVNNNCTGCRKCVEFGCPAIEFDEDSARINSLCTGCGACAQICSSNAIEVIKMRTSVCDIVLVGVGGHGVILLSNIIGKAATKAGYLVRGAETHGMAQRGGSVMNHIRLGCEFGPLVPAGGADVLLAFEPAEALRYAHYLSKDGIALVNTYPVHPTTVTTGKARYPPLEEILTPLRRIYKNIKTLDATKLAANSGTPQAMNVVMLGALSKYIPLREEMLIESLRESVPAKFLEVNKRAFESGKRAIKV